MAKKISWCLSPTGKKAHLVEELANGKRSRSARCGVRQKDGLWEEQPVHDSHEVCVNCLSLGDPKEEVHEAQVNFVQVIGQPIPLCWIPVDDVKAVVMLLATHMPKDECLKITRAQFEAAIGHLNQYISEAEDRNRKTEMAVTWTHSGEKQKGK